MRRSGCTATSTRLTKDALLEATSLIGITKQYAMKSPAHLLQPHLNYWYKNEGGVQGQTLKALASPKTGMVHAFTKGTLHTVLEPAVARSCQGRGP